MARGGQSLFYQADGLGSIIDLTDINGAVVQSYVYNSFGNIEQQVGNIVNPYTYTGREIDTETGLYFYRARYYDSITGRFINEDPIGFAAGDNNFYRYVQNNPVNFIDPEGLDIVIELPAGVDPEDFDPTDLVNPFGAAAAVGKNLCKSIGKIANKFRKSKSEVRKAIHETKKIIPKGKQKNPDVQVDLNSGEVFPITPGGGVGDSIGNINDAFK